MRIKVNKCYSCICNACTRFYCPYPNQRCRTCNRLDFKRIFDCDYFENVRTAPSRYRIKRIRKHGKDEVNIKLDYIIANLGLAEPQYDTDGTYSVNFKDMEIFRGSKSDAKDYIAKMQQDFSVRLVVKKLDIRI